MDPVMLRSRSAGHSAQQLLPLCDQFDEFMTHVHRTLGGACSNMTFTFYGQATKLDRYSYAYLKRVRAEARVVEYDARPDIVMTAISQTTPATAPATLQIDLSDDEDESHEGEAASTDSTSTIDSHFAAHSNRRTPGIRLIGRQPYSTNRHRKTSPWTASVYPWLCGHPWRPLSVHVKDRYMTCKVTVSDQLVQGEGFGQSLSDDGRMDCDDDDDAGCDSDEDSTAHIGAISAATTTPSTTTTPPVCQDAPATAATTAVTTTPSITTTPPVCQVAPATAATTAVTTTPSITTTPPVCQVAPATAATTAVTTTPSTTTTSSPAQSGRRLTEAEIRHRLNIHGLILKRTRLHKGYPVYTCVCKKCGELQQLHSVAPTKLGRHRSRCHKRTGGMRQLNIFQVARAAETAVRTKRIAPSLHVLRRFLHAELDCLQVINEVNEDSSYMPSHLAILYSTMEDGMPSVMREWLSLALHRHFGATLPTARVPQTPALNMLAASVYAGIKPYTAMRNAGIPLPSERTMQRNAPLPRFQSAVDDEAIANALRLLSMDGATAIDGCLSVDGMALSSCVEFVPSYGQVTGLSDTTSAEELRAAVEGQSLVQWVRSAKLIQTAHIAVVTTLDSTFCLPVAITYSHQMSAWGDFHRMISSFLDGIHRCLRCIDAKLECKLDPVSATCTACDTAGTRCIFFNIVAISTDSEAGQRRALQEGFPGITSLLDVGHAIKCLRNALVNAFIRLRGFPVSTRMLIGLLPLSTVVPADRMAHLHVRRLLDAAEDLPSGSTVVTLHPDPLLNQSWSCGIIVALCSWVDADFFVDDNGQFFRARRISRQPELLFKFQPGQTTISRAATYIFVIVDGRIHTFDARSSRFVQKETEQKTRIVDNAKW
ncbi:hypothetical protein PTSG_06860 [Salpingoeca rosetta]|uniref:Uncharacterized protein n=1 Tax=Salpingoeca rosetta (strain ATCC 50818 / BSB-021) TaxID=946362 RepID=F2UF08_SALR5|nr:uncharacterized protein PTSG_06860 [Salpingoeca rosetta]EGD75208.1 hypothetical protein PTSG_06860 [Salpingoeca rosetta]|eukprot:XP_004992261.1 hypothetical protein PTSG_06860 [Salpingoeca rosetta]